MSEDDENWIRVVELPPVRPGGSAKTPATWTLPLEERDLRSREVDAAVIDMHAGGMEATGES